MHLKKLLESEIVKGIYVLKTAAFLECNKLLILLNLGLLILNSSSLQIENFILLDFHPNSNQAEHEQTRELQKLKFLRK